MRETPVGNGRLLVNFTQSGAISDIFYPHVGKENHSQYSESPFKIKDINETSTFNSESWNIDTDYVGISLISKLSGKKKDLEITFLSCVHPQEDFFIAGIEANNAVEVIWELNLDINGHDFGNTAFYDPIEKAVFYYKDDTWFLISGKEKDFGITEYSIGRDENATALQGKVSVELSISTFEKEKSYFYLIAGNSFNDLKSKHKKLQEIGLKDAFDKSRYSCESVAGQCQKDFKDLSKEIKDLYLRSILILLSNINHNGAITAGCDSSNLSVNKDTYQYLWPRDGAYVAGALDEAGYVEYSHQFYEFAKKYLIPIDDGWLWHKYNVDGTYSSTWHTFVNQYTGKPQLPIQEDEIAILIWSFAQHRHYCHDVEEKSYYYDWLKKFADFLVDYRDENGLPKPSYDLWEEDYGVFSYTCATVFAGLVAAGILAKEFGDSDYKKYENAAQEVKKATVKALFSNELNRFLRDIEYHGDKLVRDDTLDASLFALWYYGMLDCSDPMIESTMTQLKEKLWVGEGIGGFQRYNGDQYHTKEGNPANPWIICTLWIAYWHILRNEKVEALELINWVVEKTPKSGVMPEQFDSLTGECVSVGPLTWSHATFIDVINRYLKTF